MTPALARVPGWPAYCSVGPDPRILTEQYLLPTEQWGVGPRILTEQYLLPTEQ